MFSSSSPSTHLICAHTTTVLYFDLLKIIILCQLPCRRWKGLQVFPRALPRPHCPRRSPLPLLKTFPPPPPHPRPTQRGAAGSSGGDSRHSSKKFPGARKLTSSKKFLANTLTVASEICLKLPILPKIFGNSSKRVA